MWVVVAHRDGATLADARFRDDTTMRAHTLSNLVRAPRACLRARRSTTRSVVARASNDDARACTRRAVLVTPVIATILSRANDARAGAGPRVLVVGSTGQTGKYVVEELVRSGKAGEVVAGVRSAEKAAKLGLDSTADAILADVDVTAGAEKLASQMDGFDIVVVATGFVPGNPFKMNAAAHEVDNLGVCAVADAAKKAGIKRVVLISSILTNGPGMGAENTPGYKITNAFGKVLEEKLVGENYLRDSGVRYTIVRPAGLKSDEPKSPLVLTGEDVMTSGEISRQLVAKVMAYAAFDPKCEGKVIEIAESGSFTGDDPTEGKTLALDSDPNAWFA